MDGKISDLRNIVISNENETNIEILKDMIDFCIEPVLIIIPVTKELSNHFPDNFFHKQIIDYINQANEKNVRFLNYWKDESYYFNSFFMNKIY